MVQHTIGRGGPGAAPLGTTLALGCGSPRRPQRPSDCLLLSATNPAAERMYEGQQPCCALLRAKVDDRHGAASLGFSPVSVFRYKLSAPRSSC